MSSKTIDKCSIYVIHALKGYEYQGARVTELFGSNNLKFEFVTDGDPIHFTKPLLDKYFVTNIESILSKGVLSCTLNHILAYEKMVAEGVEYGIVFENDPFFLGNFVEQFSKMDQEIEQLQKGFMISLENSTLRFPSYWQVRKGKFLYRADEGRMAGAYLLDLKAAKDILSDLKNTKCDYVIDWWFNSLIKRNVVKMYWAHPPLVEQGSHNGHLSSTISSKPSNISRKIKWTIQKTFKTCFRRLINDKRIIEFQADSD